MRRRTGDRLLDFAPFRSQRFRMIFAILAFGVTYAELAHAGCPPEPKPEARVTTQEAKKAAQALFVTGKELQDKQDCADALPIFLQSRAIDRRPSNTGSAARCLEQLGRFPEALALYEEILADFQPKLTPEQLAEVEEAIRSIRSKVLIAQIEEREGVFGIDDEMCGRLPRKEPVYLLPGSHVLHVYRSGKPEGITQFSGLAGQRLDVRLPPPPPETPSIPIVVEKPLRGRWFGQFALGPAFAWSGIDKLGEGETKAFVGVLPRARAGYWWPQGTMVTLTTGLFYLESPQDVDRSMLAEQFIYKGTRDTPVLASFVMVGLGGDVRTGKQFEVSAHGSFGLANIQSKNVAEVALKRRVDFGDLEQTNIIIDYAGREVVRGVSGVIGLDVGITTRIGQWRVGLSLGTMLLLDDGPALPDLYILPRTSGICGTGNVFDANDVDCVSPMRVTRERLLQPTFMVLPQLVIGL